MFQSVRWNAPASLHRDFSSDERNLTERLILVGAFAGLMALCAHISFVLPGTSVPFTMQTFAILGTGVYLRRNDAGAAGLLYLAMGAIGAPVFAGGAGGFAVLTGATAGYLFAFPIASALVAQGFDMARAKGEVIPAVQWGLWIAASLVIYLGGALGLMFIADLPLALAWKFGVAPFIGWDLFKMVLLAGATTHVWKYQ